MASFWQDYQTPLLHTVGMSKGRRKQKAMANYSKELAQNAACQSHTGHLTGLWFLPKPAQGLNSN
jgi:hypothetical protein